MSKMTTSLSLPPGVTETHLPIAKNTTIDQWAAIGEALGRVNRASAWWIGDWVNFGENRYGEAYSQYIDATGLEYKTLVDYAWVSRQFEFPRRRGNLSFSHHREVASLEPEEREKWLDRAEAEELGKSDLRRSLLDLRVFRGWFSMFMATNGGRIPGTLKQNFDGSSAFRSVRVDDIDPGFVVARNWF